MKSINYFLLLFSVFSFFSPQLEGQNLSIGDVDETMFDQSIVLEYLNTLQTRIDDGANLEKAVSSVGDLADDQNLEVAFLVMQKYLQNLNASSLDLSWENSTSDASGSISSEENASAVGSKWRRNWCFAGLASWTLCSSSCVSYGGSAWACCSCYPQECN